MSVHEGGEEEAAQRHPKVQVFIFKSRLMRRLLSPYKRYSILCQSAPTMEKRLVGAIQKLWEA